ncbi:MAG TPA: DUF3237 domain-containing protein [Acidimicrobiales bacterium]|nr:DUF3237 domain-containing protein [Acidimicrobiales bacterium]
MTPELVPLCSVDATLTSPFVVGEGPAGLRLVFEVETMRLTGDRINATLKGRSGADWFTLVGSVGSLDVRGMFETDDGALVYVQYHGRSDVAAGAGAPLYVAPRFETGDARYAWLNAIQAVGKGAVDGQSLHYDWYELR